MEYRYGEGGTCAYCGREIASYQRDPGQTHRDGKKYCSASCAKQDTPRQRRF